VVVVAGGILVGFGVDEYVASPKAKIGRPIKLNNHRSTTPKTVSFPKRLASSIDAISARTNIGIEPRIGMKPRKANNAHQPGLPDISKNTHPLYMGMMAAQPGLPALTNTFHEQTI